jgi:PAS domain S-box-containing protein
MGLATQNSDPACTGNPGAEKNMPDPSLEDQSYLLSALLGHTESRVFFKDLHSRFVLINRAQASHLGIAAPEMAIGMSDKDFFPGNDADQALADEQEMIRSGLPLVGREEKKNWPNGRVTWASTSKMPLRSPDGKIIGTFGISHDITRSRQIQQALVESESRFQELVRAIREVFWILEVASGRITYVSPAYEEIWGRKCSDLYADGREWLAAVEDEDRPRLTKLYASVQQTPFEATFRIRWPNGEMRWIRHRGFPILEENGTVARVAGISADITDARVANQALTRNQRLLASILNSSEDAIFSETFEGTITSWNPAADKVLGYAAQEIMGASSSLLFHSGQEQERQWIVEQNRKGTAVESLSTSRRHKDGRVIPVSLTAFPVRDEAGSIIGISTIAHDRSARQELEERLNSVEAQLRVVLETTGEDVLVVNSDWSMTYASRVRPDLVAHDAVGMTLWDYEPHLAGTIFEQEYRKAMETRASRRFEGYLAPAKKWLSCTAYPAGAGLLILAQDVTEKHAIDDQLRAAQKMEAIGHLAAGIAHEINTPIQYVGDNTTFLKESWEKVADILILTQRLVDEQKTEKLGTSTPRELDACLKAADLDYLALEVPKAIDQSLDGISRVANIVRAMKEFSHPGTEEKRAVDLNKAVEATVTIARNEWKYIADVDLHLDPSLPLVVCLAGEVNQVLLNLLVNAAHAIAEAQPGGGNARGKITITTVHDGDWAELRIKDTGTGIPDACRDKVFDPFFTTKEVGKGTGQGLTLAQNVIVKKHSGRIWFETEIGKGTTFLFRLPISGSTEG